MSIRPTWVSCFIHSNIFRNTKTEEIYLSSLFCRQMITNNLYQIWELSKTEENMGPGNSKLLKWILFLLLYRWENRLKDVEQLASSHIIIHESQIPTQAPVSRAHAFPLASAFHWAYTSPVFLLQIYLLLIAIGWIVPLPQFKAFLNEQCKEIKENSRMGKTRDLFKKIGDIKGTFHARMSMIKDRKLPHNCTHLMY